jgi:hypothetical protein
MVRRLIAQLVLLAMTTGVLTSLAPAAVLPHACCLRHHKRCHMPVDAGVSRRTCGHECCRLLAVSTALFAPKARNTGHNLTTSLLLAATGPASQPFHATTEHFGRAPPSLR